ncbi:hypothetical protein V3N99_12645 [Dermatophilaceae bacterium Soc4.6]
MPINNASSIARRTVTVQQAGGDVHVEQLSIIVEGSGTHVGMVFHVFSVVDWLITELGSGLSQ